MKKIFGIITICLLMIFSTSLYGCNGNTGGVLLEFSSERIEMVTTTESQNYVITVSNAGNREISFDFNFETNLAKVVENSFESLGDGQYSISIAPIAAGKTKLKITLRGTTKSIEVPVNISEELQNISVENNIFVVRGGEALTLSSAHFNFTPADTTQNSLSFELVDGQDLTNVSWVNNTLSVGEFCTLSEINFVAKSLDVQNITCLFSVKVVSKIDLATLNISAYSQSEENSETFDPNKKQEVYPFVLDASGNITNNMELVVNDPYLFQKQIAVEYEFAGDDASYAIDVVASDGIAGDISKNSGISAQTDGFKFVIQSVKITPKGQPHTLTFKIYQVDFPANYKEITLNIFVTSKPKEIRIDGHTKLAAVELFHNSNVSKNFRFSVYPSIEGAYNEESYHYAISLYTSTDGETLLGPELSYSDVSSYMELSYGNVSFADFILHDGTNALKNLKDLSSLLSAKPKAEYNNYFVINVACIDESGDIVCQNNIFIKIYKGTTKFTFVDEYRDGTLFVAMPDDGTLGTQMFEGFSYDEGSTIGELIISQKTISSLASEVSQDLTASNLRIIITPKAVGENEFILQTQNGLYLTLKVIVVREIEQTDFALKLEDSNQNSVAEFAYKPKDALITVDTIDSIVIKGKNGSVYLTEQISTYNDTNNYSYFYSLQLVGTLAKDYFVLEGNKITAKAFTLVEGIDTPIQVQVNLIIYEVRGFKLVEKEYAETIYFDFTISAVDYVKSMNIRVGNSSSTEKTKAVSVYDKNVLSYTNQNLAEAYIYLDLQKSESFKTYDTSITLSSFRVSAGAIDVRTNRIGSIGYFYATEYIDGKPVDDVDYIGKFICDISGINTITSFTITLSLIDDTGVKYESYITINIDNYIDVDSIYLTTPKDTIYVDDTDENNSVTINVYVMPTNAMCQDIQVVIESSVSNCISYNQNGGTITFTYVSGGYGTIRIFPVSKMKTNSTIDEFGNYYYHIALPFSAADGRTKETALKISTYETLKEISSGKHYFLDTIIDCKGQNLYIPEFDNGSIRGTFSPIGTENFETETQTGGISNFVVNNNGENSGLFGVIGANAELFNLTISGRFNSDKWELEQDSNIGLVAGINKGKLCDVEASLNQAQTLQIANVASKNMSLYFGLVAGVNIGSILSTENAKISTFIVYMPMALELKLSNAVIDGTTYTISSYVGGVTGSNNVGGQIAETNPTNVVLGMFGINANVRLTANSDYLGGIAGDNKGTINCLKVIGEVENGKTSTYVGGLIGVYSSETSIVSSNTSRVFVRGNGTVSGLIGTIAVADNSNITKNKVQATDDGTRSGFNASLVIRYGGYTTIENTSVYAICPSTLTAGGENANVAETYFTRTKTSTIITGLEKEYYYGDVICVDSKNFPSKFEKIDLTQGAEQVISPSITSLVLAIYRQAKDATNQTNVLNIIDTLTLLDLTGVEATEINISSSKISTISILNFGKQLTVGGTGLANLTISSALNYKNSATISAYITNYFTDVKAYNDKDYLEPIQIVNVINKNTKKVHMNAYASVYNYKNTPIELKSNTELTFDCVQTSEIANIKVSAQDIYLTAINAQSAQTNIKVFPIYQIDDVVYYAKYEPSIDAHIFLQQKDIADAEKSVSEILINVVTGIENIVIGKTAIKAEPSDNISFSVEYDSYNVDDSLTAVLKTENGLYELTEEGYFEDSLGNRLFSLTIKGQQSLGENHFKVECEFKMVETADNYLTYRNQTLMLYFYSKQTLLYDSMQIAYNPETITSVLVNNYSYEENDGMIESNVYSLNYEQDKMLNSSAFSSSGDYNIMQVYVYTKLAEFDYIEISMNAGQNGGYLALGKDGTIDTNSVYTSIDGVVSLRIYKADIFSSDIIFDNSQHVLPITIIYSLPTKMAEGTRVPFTLDFFKGFGEDAIVCYQYETRIIAKSAKKVEFSIYGKDTIFSESGINQTYNVVRGKTYALEVDIVGYEGDEIKFDSSNPNIAKITNEGGVYYLTITSNAITYVNPYYEVVITSYGQKTENNTTTKSREQKTSLHIYEFIVEEGLFANNKLSLRVLTKVDIREQIAENLAIEYSNNITSVKQFKQDFMNNSTFELISNNISITLSADTDMATTNYIVDGFSIKPLVVMSTAPYTFKVAYNYTYKNGMPSCNVEDRDTIISGTATFEVEVYINSNEDLPLPVYSYEDLTKMNDGEYYRLANDITIRGAEFEMLTSKPMGFDGNGYKINIIGESFGANVQNVTNFALFEEIQSGAIFKNITIVMNGRKTVQIDNTYSTNGVNVAILAAVNNGIVTNCRVVSEEIIYVNIIATINIMENSYFGTLVAVNNGYISNSQVVANVSVGGASVSGFVCNNTGKISSSYVKNSRIANTSSTSSEKVVTGGFVCTNQGEITMSYIEGLQSENKIYADYQTNQYGLESKILYTASMVGGFVYQNSGKIEDCYANIPIISSSRCAGFVAINEGEISRVISLSKMKQRDTLNYAFVISYDKELAVFNDCLFLLEPKVINDYTSESNYKVVGEANDGVREGVIPGVEPIRISEFNVSTQNLEESKFKNFIVSSLKSPTSGVWFYAFDAIKANELYSSLITYSTEVEEFAIYNIDAKQKETSSFVAGRLQLVAPNLISSSRYNLEVKAAGDAVEYVYSIDDSNLAYGGRYNPYLIATATDLETYAVQKNNGVLEYYKLVCDIDYEADAVYSSSLTNKTLVAYFEGNNFDIINYAVNNKTAYISAGLFSQIGGATSVTATIKNINFAPSYVNLPNSVYVGAVAGSLVNANAYNIEVLGENIVVAGKNIVGGVFGRTNGEVEVKDIYSNVVAKASQYDSSLFINKTDPYAIYKDATYSETGSNRSKVSYAGAVIGHVGGTSKIINAQVGESVKAYASTAGLMFGGIGALSSVQYIKLEQNSYSQEIKAYAFGGIIAGETKGYVGNISINSDILHKKLFSCYPILPIAIGGIAGVIDGGTIENITSEKGYSVIGADFTNSYGDMVDGYSYNQINNPYVVKYVGGLVGYALKGTISNVDLASSGDGIIITGSNYVGGLVGYVYDNSRIDNELTFKNSIKVKITGHKKFVNQDGNEIEEMVYTSYLSEASISLITGMVFDDNLKFGLLVGYSETTCTKYETSSIIATTDKMYLYFASYVAGAVPTTFKIAYNGNLAGDIYTGSGKIKITYKNLSSGAENNKTI